MGHTAGATVYPSNIIPDRDFSSSIKKMIICFVINVLNNETIIPLSFAEYCLISANSAYDLVS